MRALFLLLALLASAFPVFAQVKPVSSQDASGTIAVTSTYQLVKAPDANRSGCMIQNNGAHVMTVRVAGASLWTVAVGASWSCNNGPIVLTDKIEITGTATEAYTAAFQ